MSDALGSDLMSVVARFNRLASARADLGMPYAQARLLVHIQERGESRISALAAADHTSQPTMTAQVQRLEASGYVTRKPDPSDARAVLVSVTPQGEAALQEVRRRRREVVRPYLDELDAQQRETLAAAVHILRDLVDRAAD